MKAPKHLIMIVDDSTTNINILAGTLGDHYRLIVAKTGQTALEHLSQQLPDLILLDVMMPGMDGFDVCRRIKADAKTKDVPIIFITAMEEPDQKTRGFALGAVDYITRPFHATEVMARVRTHISLRQMHLALSDKNRRTQAALDEKSRQMDTLIANLPGMVYRSRFDAEWQMVFVSDGSFGLTGYRPGQLTGHKGRHYSLLADPRDLAMIIRALDKAFEKKSSFEIIYRIRTAAGTEKWVLEQGVGIYDGSGKVIGTEGVVSDVTEKQKRSLALARENRHLKAGIIPRDRFGDIVGVSSAMQRVYEMIVKAAAGEDTVIIYGPSGTGKELVAKAIHKNSRRNAKPFVPVNCGAIPENLFESEFFGHKRGAFSGANADKKGVLDLADGGTLFLDELGEMSLSMQVKLLRVMDGSGYMPVGGIGLKKPDIRFVCATNQDLQQMVRDKKLREDFFFRIHIIPITLPPLKDRREDIPLLVEHFLNSYPKDDSTKALTRDMMDELIHYAWPGNIRQLQNVLYQYRILGRLEFLDPERLDKKIIRPGRPKGQTLKAAVGEFEKGFISRVLASHGSKKGKAAEALGIDRKTLFRKMKQYGIGS